MRLVIGGAYQGKLEFAEKLVEGENSFGRCRKAAEGGRDGFDQAYEADIINGFHAYIRRILDTCEDGKEPDALVWEFIRRILQVNPEVVIVMDEVGYGIVPVTPEDRAYREMAGRAGQLLAGEADQVYRVICGIGTKIK